LCQAKPSYIGQHLVPLRAPGLDDPPALPVHAVEMDAQLTADLAVGPTEVGQVADSPRVDREGRRPLSLLPLTLAR